MEPFGARLKREREQRKISLEDVSVATKIGTRFLRAIEEDHFDQLPGGIFNKGFIRAYARHLGLNEDQAVADYLEASGENKPPAATPAPEAFPLEIPEEKRPRQAAAQVPWGLLAFGLLVIAIGFAAWGAYSRQRTESGPAAPSHETAATSTPEISKPNETSRMIEASQKSLSTPVPLVATSNQNPAAGSFTLQITAREDCWITVTADGQQVIQDTLIASAQRSVAAHNQIVLHAGNVGALDLAFNGKTLPAQGDYGEVKILKFDPHGLQPLPRPPG